MRISGDHVLASPQAEVWPLISDPASLARLLPGCERLEETAPGEFRGRIHLPVPAVAGAYDTFVRVDDAGEPFATRFHGEMTGPAGTMRGVASFRLTEQGNGCVLSYEGAALITGPISRMDGRFTESVAQAMLGQGLNRLDDELSKMVAPGESASGVSVAPDAGALAAVRRWFEGFVHWLRRLMHQS